MFTLELVFLLLLRLFFIISLEKESFPSTHIFYSLFNGLSPQIPSNKTSSNVFKIESPKNLHAKLQQQPKYVQVRFFSYVDVSFRFVCFLSWLNV